MRQRFTIAQKPVLENRFRTLHHFKQAEIRKEWRTASRYIANRAVKYTEPVKITVRHEFAKGVRPDTCSCIQAYKSAQDGLIDAGILIDDTPEYVASVTFLPPEKTGRDAITLILEEA